MSEVGMKTDGGGVGGQDGAPTLSSAAGELQSPAGPFLLTHRTVPSVEQLFFFFFFSKVSASSSLVSGASKLVGHIRLGVAGCSLHHWLRLQQRAETVWFSSEKLCTVKTVSLPDCISITQILTRLRFVPFYLLVSVLLGLCIIYQIQSYKKNKKTWALTNQVTMINSCHPWTSTFRSLLVLRSNGNFQMYLEFPWHFLER